MANYTVRFYSVKPFWKRRQYYWTIKHENGNNVADGCEGYNNRKDRDEAFYNLWGERAKYKIVDEDN